MRNPNFVESRWNGSPADACQWSDDINATPAVWCGAGPVYELTNPSGYVFLSCVEHACSARKDPRGVARITSIRTFVATP